MLPDPMSGEPSASAEAQLPINPLDLTARLFLVTGASSGIGRETALLISQLGGRVILAGRDRARLEETFETLAGSGHVVSPFDLGQTEAIPEWVAQLAAEHGALHGVVHSAGIQMTKPLRQTTLSDMELMTSVNLYAALALAKGLRQKRVAQRGASLVLLSSVSGSVGRPGLTMYSATKGAIVSLTRSLALELIRDGIRVNAVSPGAVQTKMIEGIFDVLTPDQVAAIVADHPLGIGTPRDVAHAVVFLLADTGRWITGTNLVVDGGYIAH